MNPQDKLQEYEILELKQRLQEKGKRLDDEIAGIKEMLEPLIETYKMAVVLGEWIMGVLVFLSILLGIILAIQKLWK